MPTSGTAAAYLAEGVKAKIGDEQKKYYFFVFLRPISDIAATSLLGRFRLFCLKICTKSKRVYYAISLYSLMGFIIMIMTITIITIIIIIMKFSFIYYKANIIWPGA